MKALFENRESTVKERKKLLINSSKLKVIIFFNLIYDPLISY